MEASNHGVTASAAPFVTLFPHCIEAEQQVIGSLLVDNEAWIEICDLISAHDFFLESHRRIVRHIINLLNEGVVADIVTVANSLQKSHDSDQSGGVGYLKEIVSSTLSTRPIRRYADIVRDNSIRRSVIGVCDVVAGDALKPLGKDARQIIDEALARFFHLSEKCSYSSNQIETLSGALDQAVENIKGRSDQNPIPTGFIDLDSMVSGLQRGDLTVIAGPSGVGKTALALTIADHVGVGLGLPVLIFSLEMSVPQLALRFLATRTRVNLAMLKSATLSEEEWTRLDLELDQLRNAKVFISPSGMSNPVELRACARRVHRQCNGLGLIVIDSIQMMGSPQITGNRAADLSCIAQMLKALAKELNVPVLVLAQLNSEFGKHSEKRPAMSDLRELGAIDQAADLVMFLYRDEYGLEKASTDEALTEVRIGKNCNGPMGDFSLVFSRRYCRFESVKRGDTSH